MTYLRLTYRPEDDWHGELFATVENSGFSGRGSAWFGIAQLSDFCVAASQFPIDALSAPNLEGGFFDDSGTNLQQRHLGIQFSPHDRKGSILVSVMLATPVWKDEVSGVSQEVSARFLVNYGDLGRFCTSLTAMLDGKKSEAILRAHPT